MILKGKRRAMFHEFIDGASVKAIAFAYNLTMADVEDAIREFGFVRRKKPSPAAPKGGA